MRRKASVTAAAKIKYFAGPTPSRRGRKVRDDTRVRSGMGKLLKTSRKLIERKISTEGSPGDSDDELPSINPIGDFSSDDLIRNCVDVPSTFDNPPPESPDGDEIVVIKTNPPKNVSQSRWSLSSLNPLSYLRTESVQSNVDDPIVPESRALSVDQLVCPDESVLAEPRHASTPNDDQ